MSRLLSMFSCRRFTEDPVATLWHYMCGQMADWEFGGSGPVIWKSRSHRGVQWLHKVVFPRKQKRYIFSPLFEIRYDTSFEEVIRACAESGMQKENKTWIVEGFVQGMLNLHKMGFAHSYEAWNEGKLVGGAFGVQMGSMVTCDSMFHRMSNASKAAYGQTLVRLQQRGFKVVDTNGVAQHLVNYGEEWMPQWQFEGLIIDCLKEWPTFSDDRPAPRLPWEIRALLRPRRLVRAVGRKLLRRGKSGAAPAAPAASESGLADKEHEASPEDGGQELNGQGGQKTAP